MAAQREELTHRGIGPDAGDELAGDPAPPDYGEQAAQRRIDPSEQGGIGVPRYTDTDLRALALEHAVATRSADDQSDGKSTVKRANEFYFFLRGEARAEKGDQPGEWDFR